MDESKMSKDRPATNRRRFLAGLLAGAGVTAAAAASAKPARIAKPVPQGGTGPILFKPGKESERYFRTLQD